MLRVLHSRCSCRAICGECSHKGAVDLQGIPSTSVQFGAWAGAGMAGGALASKLERSGLLLVAPPLGLRALGGIPVSSSRAPQDKLAVSL